MPKADDIEVRGDTRYVHMTSNETIEGIQLRALPDVGVSLVVDISSDFLTNRSTGREWTSPTVACRRTSAPLASPSYHPTQHARGLCQRTADLPGLLRARSGREPAQHAADVLHLRGAQDARLDRGEGRAGMAERANRRSGLIYDVLDTSDGFYTGPAQLDARSRTNVVFRLASPELNDRFLAGAQDAGRVNLKDGPGRST